MDDHDWLASIPVATDEEIATLVVPCRLGNRRCQATCRLHKRSDGKWSAPEGWVARPLWVGVPRAQHMMLQGDGEAKMATKDFMTPTIGVIDMDGLHRVNRPLAPSPMRGATRHGGVPHGAWRHGPLIGREEGR